MSEPRTDEDAPPDSTLRWHRLSSLTDATGVIELLAATCIDGIGVIVRWTKTDQGWDTVVTDTEAPGWAKVRPGDEDIPQEPPTIFDDAVPGQTEAAQDFARKRQEFFNTPLATPWKINAEEEKLRELARKYHERAEAFDRAVCAGREHRGSSMPADPDAEPRALSTRNARGAYIELGLQAAALGFTPGQWRHAIRQEGRERDRHP